MASNYPGSIDDLSIDNVVLYHGDVSDAIAAVQETLGTNPQGDAPTVAARIAALGGGSGGGGRLLTGAAAPLSGSGLDPLGGVNDPWRWSSALGGWVGPAFEVSWGPDAEIPSFAAPANGLLTVVVSDGVATTPAVASSPFGFPQSILSLTSGGVIERGPSVAASTTAAGSGTAFLLWDFFSEVQASSEGGLPTDFTATAADTLPAETRTLADFLGPDFTLDAPFTWNETGDGEIGDYWRIDSPNDYFTHNHIFGPKTEAGWGASRGMLLNPDQYQIVNEPWFFYGADAEAPIQLKGGTEPADIDINPGDVGVWYEPTTGAPVMHFKGKDDAGTVFTASLPLT